MVAEVRPSKQVSLPENEYTLDISGPLKVYAYIESSVYIYSDSERTYITLDESTRITFGARSYHRRPATTITSTAEPTDVMKAISAFGSALKSTTPERSYPTHRGHPAAIEMGDRLIIPEAINQPKTGIQIEIPPELGQIFVITPLAYYLGAKVVPGKEPQLTTEDGFTYNLEREDTLEETVEQTLKQVFFLDCIVRTEGHTPLPLHERQIVEPMLEFDICSIYNKKLFEQLEIYLSVDFERVEPYFPEWRLKTYLPPTPDAIEFLPYVTDDLAIIKVQKQRKKSASVTQTEAIEDFLRTGNTRTSRTRKLPTDQTGISTIQQSWSSASSSNITSKTSLSAFQHSVGRSPREDPIEIEVVCNDTEMREELETVNGVYGVREELPFDVSLRYDLEISELEKTLTKNIDFFHFIGHIDEDGFQCTDGKLDVASMEKVGAKAFFLNACQSYDQGLHLVESGSIGGIVTLNDIVNSGAIKVGSEIARLLNQGFPLYAALDVVRKDNIISQQYIISGDGMTTIAQSETGPPFVCLIDREEDDFVVRMETYTTTGLQKGSLCIPYLEENDVHFLTSGESGPFISSEKQLSNFFEMGDFPVIVNGSLNWSSEILLDEL
ncbi:hypothetical protein RBH26_10780 [Natronolimnohabitans sp. A-GB9]|uniref:hypothetical protein n=1 Tax=Natronolimnohabitans sp. A-GB9 TaxID=3069757 RepID=UPI0027B78BA3|nr:hypothetical protein [Natronolimnohabitans sp. A-GB9]MDQ2050963.1 hypothetical protein [Natronolimnohabitans sp. A-GB9]